ncbi:hypothetical protein MKX08_008514 [Trichoderma sp. CBMAI-0020]|nr:hypothetical protein MKX08_008514 [Trichoderma sp. CBMAI-0020]
MESSQAAAMAQYAALRIIFNLFLHPLSKIPGPITWKVSRLPFIWALLRGTLVHDVERLHRRYGPILRISPNDVTFAHEDAIRDILAFRKDRLPFLKDLTWWKANPGMPDSMISIIDPKQHARIRNLLAPGFTPRALKEQEDILHLYVNLLVERIRELASKEPESGAIIDVVRWFNFTTFDIFGDLGYGESFNCLQDSKYHPWVALLFKSVKAVSFIAAARLYPVIERILFMCIPPSLREMQKNHCQLISDKVHRRLNFELERPDLMYHVIQGAERQRLPQSTIDTTFMVLTIAGSETTATALSGTLNYLVNNTDKLEILKREIHEAFPAENDISLDALRKLPYLNAVINEGLRLCPPVPWIIPRKVPEGGETVCGTWLPGGTSVSVQAYTLNRDPDHYHMATSFHPERWLPDARTNPKSPFFHDRLETMQPFSEGRESCLGQHLALAEIRLIFSKLLWSFDFEALEDRKTKWEDMRTFLIVEKKVIEMRAKLRATA